MLDPACEAQLRTCVKTSNDFSLGVLDFLGGRSEEEQAAWLKACVNAGRTVFQPWAMEILYALAVKRRARFTELQHLLGVSSRTLSDKLQMLRGEGFLERDVFDEQPVRIEYFLTKHGRTTAALTSPLFATLNRGAAKNR